MLGKVPRLLYAITLIYQLDSLQVWVSDKKAGKYRC